MGSTEKDKRLKIKDERRNVEERRQGAMGFFNISFIFYLLSFSICLFNGLVIEDIAAHSQHPAPGSSQSTGPFPPRQVEKNVAVDFYYQPLPQDEEGFEKELLNFTLSFSDHSGEEAAEGDQGKGEDEGQKGESLENSPKPVYVDQDVVLLFKVTDATMNWPIQGLVPDCPIRFVPGGGNLESTKKQIKIRADIFGGHFPITEYTYLFVLNSLDCTVSVIDTAGLWKGMPIEIIPLSEEQGRRAIDMDMEWLGRYAYATLDTEEVVVIDCMRLELIRRIKVGKSPHHVFVQPDGKYAWVCNDGDNTLSVIDTGTQELVKTIPVGHGHHEIAFTADSHYGCVTNQDDNSVTILDVYTLSTTGVVPVGSKPHGLGYSNLSQFMYVANEGEGTVSVVNLWSKKVVRTISVGKGVRKVRFGPDPRWGFAPNKDDDTCSMIDVSRDSVYETIETGKGPEDVSFTPGWVFIRNTASYDMTAMSMERMELIANVPIGYRKPIEVDLPLGHTYISPQADGHSVLIPSPAGRAVYRYAPGEAAGGTTPGDIYNTQANGSSKILVYYRSVKEVSSGVFARTVRFGRPGRYEIGFYVDNPELVAAFELKVQPLY